MLPLVYPPQHPIITLTITLFKMANVSVKRSITVQQKQHKNLTKCVLKYTFDSKLPNRSDFWLQTFW